MVYAGSTRIMRLSLAAFVFSVMLTPVGAIAAEQAEKISISITKPENLIREKFLKLTPLGESASDVLDFIKSNLDYEYMLPPSYTISKGVRRPDKDDSMLYDTIGDHSIQVSLGTYRPAKLFFLWKSRVYVSWAFDSNDRLIALFVDKLTLSH